MDNKFVVLIINSLETLLLVIRDIVLALIYPKYLHNDPKDYLALRFETILGETKASLVKRDKQWVLTNIYKGEKRPTTIFVINKYDPAKPTIIYHHGAGSTHPKWDFEYIFGEEFKQKFNVFVVWAQYHHSKGEYIHKSVDSFVHNQQTFAGSVLAYEEIVRFHRSVSKQKIVATGNSMGGIVSSLHAFYFGGADYYFPLVAYPNVGEIFLGDAYKQAVDDITTKRKNKSYFDSFRIEEFDKKLTKKVFPIIGTNDRIVNYKKARDFWVRGGFEIVEYPYGHATSWVKRKDIRQMIIDKSGII